MNTRNTAAALAIAAAGIFAVLPVASMAGSDSDVHCYGVNECKGHNDCKTAKNACKGKGSCKGQGFVNMSEAECEEAGGKVEE